MRVGVRSLVLGLVLGVASGCIPRLDGREFDVTALCNTADRLFKAEGKERSGILAELERQVPVAPKSVDVNSEFKGMFIRMGGRWVEEWGYFIAQPGAVLPGPEADPAFWLIEQCLYRYHIKG